jgi:hypothetical protein
MILSWLSDETSLPLDVPRASASAIMDAVSAGTEEAASINNHVLAYLIAV